MEFHPWLFFTIREDLSGVWRYALKTGGDCNTMLFDKVWKNITKQVGHFVSLRFSGFADSRQSHKKSNCWKKIGDCGRWSKNRFVERWAKLLQEEESDKI